MTATKHDFPETIAFLQTRRSVPAKTMADDGVGPDDAEIAAFVGIAARVPDHGKIAPWRFVRYTRTYCAQLGEWALKRALELDPGLDEQLQAQEKERFLRAPVVIGVVSRPRQHPKVPEWEQLLSAGAAAMNLLHAANAHGWDAQWLTEWVAFDDALRQPLGLADGEKLAGLVYIGKRTMPKTERDRPPLDSIFSTMDVEN